MFQEDIGLVAEIATRIAREEIEAALQRYGLVGVRPDPSPPLMPPPEIPPSVVSGDEPEQTGP